MLPISLWNSRINRLDGKGDTGYRPSMTKETRHLVDKIDPRLLEILICPLTGGPLEYEEKTGELISKKAGLAYQIREGVPIMLPDEARVLS